MSETYIASQVVVGRMHAHRIKVRIVEVGSAFAVVQAETDELSGGGNTLGGQVKIGAIGYAFGRICVRLPAPSA